jgi:hypothetical protein
MMMRFHLDLDEAETILDALDFAINEGRSPEEEKRYGDVRERLLEQHPELVDKP